MVSYADFQGHQSTEINKREEIDSKMLQNFFDTSFIQQSFMLRSMQIHCYHRQLSENNFWFH